MEKRERIKAFLLRTVSYILVAALASFVTLMLMGRSVKLAQVEKTINSYFVGEVDKTAMTDAAASAMVSSLFKDDITHPERLANLHYFNPALVMKLVEVVQGEHCADDAVENFSNNSAKSPGHDYLPPFAYLRFIATSNSRA